MIDKEQIVGVIDFEDMLYEQCLSVSLDLDLLCVGALAHHVTSLWLIFTYAQ